MTRAGRLSVTGLAAIFLLGGGASAVPLAAQVVPAARQDTVDRIVAVVGNTVVLGSEVEEELFSRFPRGEGMPTDPAQLRSLRRQILEELVDLELMYRRALADTNVRVTEEQVTSAVDEQLRNARQQFPSDAAFREEIRRTGFQTAEEYRRFLTDRQRRQLVTNTLIEYLRASGALKPVMPTERELRAFFEAQKGRQQRPGTISFRQIVVAPKAAEAARRATGILADSILTELRGGGDFATAARRFSQDPGSREQGGSLGWFRRGVGLHPLFEDVAFSLRPGVISNPVETPFGFHLIQVERVQPAEVLARHILLMPELTEADADSARALAHRIRAQLQSGVPFDSLQQRYHDTLEEREVRDFPYERLLPMYNTAIGGLQPMEFSSVFELPAQGDLLRTKYAVVQLVNRRDTGEFTFEDVKDQIRGRLGEQMALRRYLDTLRSATYVDVRGP